jgi:NADH-quinone oxidoreductase subunit L
MANAAQKLFIVTRLGDFGFLAAILVLYVNAGTFDNVGLQEMAIAGVLAGSTLTGSHRDLCRAAGKSAQFPRMWLPDAMEGHPRQRLIHAATMGGTGRILVARTLPLFEHSSQALNTVGIIEVLQRFLPPRWVWSL